MAMWYWSEAILFWQLSIDHIVNVLKSYIKDVDLPRHAWDTPPFLLIVSPTLPVQSVDAYVRTYVRTLGQSRDNQRKRGWPYSMSMGLCLTRASRAREPRYKSGHESQGILDFVHIAFIEWIVPDNCKDRFRGFTQISDRFHHSTVQLTSRI